MLAAIKTAEARWAAGEQPPNGVFVWNVGSNIGTGFAKTTAQSFSSTWAAVVIDVKTGLAKTAYPVNPAKASPKP